MKKITNLAAFVALTLPLLTGTAGAAEVKTSKELKKALATDFQKSIPLIAASFKEHCSLMAAANLGSFGLTADELGKLEQVPGETVTSAKESAATTLEPVLKLITESGDMFSKVNFEENDETKALVAKMLESAEGCQAAHNEIELLASDVKKFLKGKDYVKSLTEKDFSKRVGEVTRHVIKTNPKKYPTLNKEQ